MAHPIYMPKRTFFYPIGNTSPICLTQDIAPDQSANILLLGCGDPRNILYTLYASGADEASLQRTLDFTCCDIDAAVLARNYLLFTLLIDGEVSQDHLWNIFYDFYLKKEPSDALAEHCRKLGDTCKDAESWRASKYGRILKFCTERTRTEMRNYWTFYSQFNGLPEHRKAKVQAAFSAGMKNNQMADKVVLSVGRAAGPLFVDAMTPTSTHFTHFWRTGINSVDPKDREGATHINPTFAYSASKEGFDVHYGTDCLGAFPLTPAFTCLKASPAATTEPIANAVAIAKLQFEQWCSAFKTVVNADDPRLVIRVFAGDALAFCSALKYYSESGSSVATPAYSAPWRADLITWDSGDYDEGVSPAPPMAFDVIDTSNLTDHLGLLNILAVTRPLLTRRASSTLYTEALLPLGPHAISRFAEHLCGDLNGVCLLFDLAPSASLSKFTTNSNVHEILLYRAFKQGQQFHERVSWKIPSLVDAGSDHSPSEVGLNFDPQQLGAFLFGIYRKLFADEDVSALLSGNVTPELLKARSLIHYVRASFVAILKEVRSRIATDWKAIMNNFLDFMEADNSLLMGSNNYQDLYCQLHLLDVFSVGTLIPDNPIIRARLPSKILPGWKTVPAMVSLTLVVPRDRLQKLEQGDSKNIGTPILVCEAQSSNAHNFFSSLHTAFGELTSSGTGDEVELSLKEDASGWSGKSDLVVWFWIPTFVLLHAPSETNISFSIRSTPESMRMVQRTGINLKLFTTRLLNRDHVYISRDFPNSPGELEKKQTLSLTRKKFDTTIDVQLNRTGEVLATLTCRLDFPDKDAQEVLLSGAAVSQTQTSPCSIKVSFGEISKIASFPFPVDGTKAKLRMARKSHYIEVIAPPTGPHSQGGLSVNPFPVIFEGGKPTLWNMHRLYLDRQPALDITKRQNLDRWLNTHVTLSLSDREKAMRSAGQKSNQDPYQTLVDVKESLHVLYMRYTGLQGGGKHRVFGLSEPDMGGVYALIFITDLRLDLAAQTAVLDAFALPLTIDRVSDLAPLLRRLGETKEGVAQIVTKDNEMRAWKRLLAASAERCRRTWAHTADCAYVRAGGCVPLSTEYAENPLCGCGEGKDIGPFEDMKGWADAAPYVTRVAISPLFAVSYLESVAGDADTIGESVSGGSQAGTASRALHARTSSQASGSQNCGRCGNSGTAAKPLLVCGRCKAMKYCSAECQRADWKTHKLVCNK
ncbi:hypothetical protein DENSPDRAFT_831464 [Dentipellis sp. KUC8613]|nr:hypothetical protein DENSPDRAFT_831464 [Dentipellis sp. KUC8613]